MPIATESTSVTLALLHDSSFAVLSIDLAADEWG